MNLVKENEQIWLAHDLECYLPCVALQNFRQGDTQVRVRRPDGSIVVLSGQETFHIHKVHPQSFGDLDDMVLFDDLSEASLLHNLRIRYNKDVIFTNIGSILVSVNPFKQLPIYTREVMGEYIRNRVAQPPHSFTVADRAYQDMKSTLKNQAILISGESGAGKTETMKHILQYLVEASMVTCPEEKSGEDGLESVEAQILAINPLTESFGNAKTVHNNNSSRFAKWAQLAFTNQGHLVGAHISSYLLEKSRVSGPAVGERNFHVFYQLIAACASDDSLREKYDLAEAVNYHYLTTSDTMVAEGINDLTCFHETRRAITALIGSSEDSVFTVVSAVVTVGNVSFVTLNQDELEVVNPEVLESTCRLLELSSSQLKAAFTKRRLAAQQQVILVPHSMEQACDVRDALAKALYARLFDWLISHCNMSLRSHESCLEQVIHTPANTPSATSDKKGKFFNSSNNDNDDSPAVETKTDEDDGGLGAKNLFSTIGILDIFGFESFEKNSFEQLCINYCNEKLQFFFNTHIFEMENEVYRKEGVDVSNSQIQFSDNGPVVNLLEGKSIGIFSMMDEELLMPKGSDRAYLEKLVKRQSSNDCFRNPKKARDCFEVIHFAGVVRYNVNGILDKNRDELVPDIQNVLLSSNNDFVRELFSLVRPMSPTASGNIGKKVQQSVSSQFKIQLSNLMTRLNLSEPHFIRCIKANKQKRPAMFQSIFVLRQLRYSGILEVCRIRKQGYPHRIAFAEFLERYGSVCRRITLVANLIAYMVSRQWLGAGDCVVGQTKVFAKNETVLEQAKLKATTSKKVLIFSCLLGFYRRSKYKRMKSTLASLKEAVATDNLAAIEKFLPLAMTVLPNGGKQLEVVQTSSQLVSVHLELVTCVNEFSNAIEKRSKAAIVELLQKADALWGTKLPSSVQSSVREAKIMLDRLTREEKINQSLYTATKARDVQSIDTYLRQARELSMDNQFVSEARAVLKCIRRLFDSLDSREEAVLLAAVAEGEALKIEKTVKEMMNADLALKLMRGIRKLDGRVLVDCVNHYDTPGAGFAYDSRLRELAEWARSLNQGISMMSNSLDRGDIKEAEDAVKFCSSNGVSMDSPFMKESLSAIQILKQREVVRGDISSAVELLDFAKLRISLEEARTLQMGEDTFPELTQAYSVIHHMEEQDQCKTGLRRMAVSKDTRLEDVEAGLEWSKNLGIGKDDISVKAGKAKLLQLKKERVLISDAAVAIEKCDGGGLKAALFSLKRAGVDDSKFLLETSVMRILQACTDGDIDELEASLEQAAELGLSDSSPVLSHGEETLERLQKENVLISDIRAIVDVSRSLASKASGSRSYDGKSPNREHSDDDSNDMESIMSSQEEMSMMTFDDVMLRIRILRDKLRTNMMRAREYEIPEETPILHQARETFSLLDKKEQILNNLRSSILSWDKSLLIVSYRAAREMHLETEDVRLADNLLNALVQLDKLCQEAFDADGISDALKRVQSLSIPGPNGKILEEWVLGLIQRVDAQEEFRIELSLVCDKLSNIVGVGQEVQDAVDELEEELARCEEYGLRDRCDEWTAAVALLTRLKRMLRVSSEIQTHIDGRDMVQLEAALEKAKELGLNDTNASILSRSSYALVNLIDEKDLSRLLIRSLTFDTIHSWDAILNAAIGKNLSLTKPQYDWAMSKVNDYKLKVELRLAAMEGTEENDYNMMNEVIQTIEKGNFASYVVGENQACEPWYEYIKNSIEAQKTFVRKGKFQLDISGIGHVVATRWKLDNEKYGCSLTFHSLGAVLRYKRDVLSLQSSSIVEERWYGKGPVADSIQKMLKCENLSFSAGAWASLCVVMGVRELNVFMDHPEGCRTTNGEAETGYSQMRAIGVANRESNMHHMLELTGAIITKLNILQVNPSYPHHAKENPNQLYQVKSPSCTLIRLKRKEIERLLAAENAPPTTTTTHSSASQNISGRNLASEHRLNKMGFPSTVSQSLARPLKMYMKESRRLIDRRTRDRKLGEAIQESKNSNAKVLKRIESTFISDESLELSLNDSGPFSGEKSTSSQRSSPVPGKLSPSYSGGLFQNFSQVGRAAAAHDTDASFSTESLTRTILDSLKLVGVEASSQLEVEVVSNADAADLSASKTDDGDEDLQEALMRGAKRARMRSSRNSISRIRSAVISVNSLSGAGRRMDTMTMASSAANEADYAKLTESLPPGWEIGISKSKDVGRVFYINKATKERRWTPPLEK